MMGVLLKFLPDALNDILVMSILIMGVFLRLTKALNDILVMGILIMGVLLKL